MDYALAGGVILSGLTIVFAVLVILTLMVAALGKMLGGSDKKNPQSGEKVAEPTQVAPAALAQPIVEDGISDETVAVISASIAAVLGGTATLRSVKHAHGHKGGGRRTAWSLAGMQQNTSPF